MKTSLKYFSMMIAVLLLSCTMWSCGDDKDEPDDPNKTETPKTLNEQLVGRWIETNLEDGEDPFILVLSANQTGTLSYSISSNSSSRATITITQSFRWDAGTNANGLSYVSILTTGGDPILDDGQYTLTIIGDDLSFGGLRFKRA